MFYELLKQIMIKLIELLEIYRDKVVLIDHNLKELIDKYKLKEEILKMDLIEGYKFYNKIKRS